MIPQGKLYQHYLVRIYPNRNPRQTVSERVLRMFLPDQFPALLQRASGREYGNNFTVRITGFGRVRFYFCAHYRAFRKAGGKDICAGVDN